MKKGIVMHIDDAFLILLTPEGEFLRARKLEQTYTLGEEIYFYPIANTDKNPFLKRLNQFVKLKPMWLAAIALIIILGSLLPMFQTDKAYAYLSIDVNPSIELGVNVKMQVIELKGFNPEGKKVVAQLKNWKKHSAAEVTKVLLINMQKKGLLENHKHVIFSTVRIEKMEEEAEKKLQKNISEIKDAIYSQHLELTVLSCTKKELKKAHELGVTAGKYQANYRNEKDKAKSNEQRNNRKNGGKIQRDFQETQRPGPIKKQAMDANGDHKGKIVLNNKAEKKLPPGQLKKADKTRFNSPKQKQQKVAQSGQSKKYSNQKSKKNKNSPAKKDKQRKNHPKSKVKQWEPAKSNGKKQQHSKNNSKQPVQHKNKKKQKEHRQSNPKHPSVKQPNHPKNKTKPNDRSKHHGKQVHSKNKSHRQQKNKSGSNRTFSMFICV